MSTHFQDCLVERCLFSTRHMHPIGMLTWYLYRSWPHFTFSMQVAIMYTADGSAKIRTHSYQRFAMSWLCVSVKRWDPGFTGPFDMTFALQWKRNAFWIHYKGWALASRYLIAIYCHKTYHNHNKHPNCQAYFNSLPKSDVVCVSLLMKVLQSGRRGEPRATRF